MLNKVDGLVIGMQNRLYHFWNDDRGDTNFISMLVILGIALALAAVFLALKDRVLVWVENNISGFFQATDAGANGKITTGP